MFGARKGEKNKSMRASPWIVLGSAAILLIVVVILAARNYNREKEYMSRLLSEKGAALIRAVEAGARTGMMGMFWGGDQVQYLLEETARFPDVDYLAVLQQDGLILAHSDRSKVGTVSTGDLAFEDPSPSGKISWAVVESEEFDRSFEVYRYFKPVPNRENFRRRRMGRMMGRRGAMHSGDNDWCLAAAEGDKEHIILVGLDVKPFEEARAEDIRNVVVISGVLVLLGLAGFVSMFWMHNYHAARRSLSDTSAFAGELAANLPVGLVATDKDGKIAFFNSSAERITGLEFSQAKGNEPEKILPDFFRGFTDDLAKGKIVSEKEMECEFANGKRVPVSVTASRIVNEDGQFVGQVMIVRDLGEIRSLQEEIRRKEKMAALGGLAAGVAHEIRNPLSSIKGMASYLGGKFDLHSEDREAADVMIREVDRLNRVVGELLEFARPARLKPKQSDINELLRHSVTLVQNEASAKKIDIRLELSDDRLVCGIDPDRLSQCLLNLYINAFQAMGDRGTLTVRSLPGENGFVGIDVQDTGPGVKGDDLAKIFDPYFTTKPKGTGLGLAIAHKIVEAHGGTITVRNLSEGGALFSIQLPKKKESRG